jgi:hypothetical protein
MRIREDVLERDYCLAWFLSALSESELRQVFAFKGGTALKRCYFSAERPRNTRSLSARPFTSSFRAAVVDAHSGQSRILFPLPRSWTNGCGHYTVSTLGEQTLRIANSHKQGAALVLTFRVGRARA